MDEMDKGVERRRKVCSVIIPVFNEQECLHELHRRLLNVAEERKEFDWEFIFIDDGSTDQSPQIIQKLHQEDPRVKALKLSKNFGSHIAIKAGFDHCSGDVAIVIAADMQDPPELITSFLEKWEEGEHIIWGIRKNRKDPLLRRFVAKTFYWVVRKVALPNYPLQGTGSFCLVDRKVINTLRLCEERNRVTFGLVSWLGFKQGEIFYERKERFAGTSKWGLAKMAKTAIDSFVSFSYFPIRIISYFGVIVSIISFLLGIYVILNKILAGARVMGWSSLMLTMLFLGGIQLIMLGIIGEYIWRIAEDTKRRPLYIVEKQIGFSRPKT
jgi:dolichol-phosphate mannosyltransferase